MQKRKYKIILDTNLWIKFLLSGGMEAIDLLLENDALEIIVSEDLIAEFEEVTSRPKFSKIISAHKKRAIKNFIKDFTTKLPIVSSVQVCGIQKMIFSWPWQLMPLLILS